MNKKLLSVVLSATCVIALAACGGSNDATILADADHATYCVVGPSQTTIGGESIAWDYSEAGVMTASSRNDLKEVSLDLYNDLKAVKLSSLYILEDVVIGAEAAGYNKTALLDGALVQADGALTLKTASINYDAVDDVYSIDEWLVSPEHYGETLTPDTFWCSPHYETPDENGFSHASDPVVVGGAGSYTVVLARYVDTKEDGSTLGIGLVLQEANPEGQQVTPIVPVDVTSLGAIGSFAASEGWTVEAALTKNEEDVWEGDVEAVAGNEFKIRANGAWTYSWGFAAVTVAAAGIISNVDGNIGAVADGTYHISIVAPAQLSLISQDLTSFEITFEPAGEGGEDPDPIESVLLAKYDLADVVRTPYDAGGNTKYAVGEFATFLSTKVVAGGTDNLASSSGETNVYYAEQSASATGPQFNGIKFGSSSAGGSVTLAFDAGTNITKVVVGCAGWATPNADTLSVGGVVKTPVQGSATATVEEIVFDLTAASDSIAIETNKRIVFNYISVYVAAAE